MQLIFQTLLVGILIVFLSCNITAHYHESMVVLYYAH